jgi:hypothetical protein
MVALRLSDRESVLAPPGDSDPHGVSTGISAATSCRSDWETDAALKDTQSYLEQAIFGSTGGESSFNPLACSSGSLERLVDSALQAAPGRSPGIINTKYSAMPPQAQTQAQAQAPAPVQGRSTTAGYTITGNAGSTTRPPGYTPQLVQHRTNAYGSVGRGTSAAGAVYGNATTLPPLQGGPPPGSLDLQVIKTRSTPVATTAGSSLYAQRTTRNSAGGSGYLPPSGVYGSARQNRPTAQSSAKSPSKSRGRDRDSSPDGGDTDQPPAARRRVGDTSERTSRANTEVVARGNPRSSSGRGYTNASATSRGRATPATSSRLAVDEVEDIAEDDDEDLFVL